MALLKINKEDDKMVKLTPEEIQSKLFYFHNAAHKYHLDTKDYSAHKALDKLYKELVDFKDDILELLMGYMSGKRIGDLKMDSVSKFNENSPLELADEILSFAKKLEEWAEQNEYCDLENKAQDLSGLAAKTIYLLTLK